MVFSERFGLKKVRLEPQLASMDQDLRNGLWNVFDEHLIQKAAYNSGYVKVLMKIWTEYYKKARDEFPRRGDYPAYFKRVFREGPWYEVYDIVELTTAALYDIGAAYNRVLERDVAGYRIIDGVIAPIVESDEIAVVNDVLQSRNGKFRLARQHVARAVELYSDRKSPDYRNAIKEAISGAESAACTLTGTKKFQEALKALTAAGLHPALAGVFSQLYGYTSDESGVRHALLDQATVGQPEAHYMIVSCSAFVSYLMAMP